jgi:hypothetical protein
MIKSPPEIVEKIRAALDASIRDRVGQSELKMAHEPASGVLRVSVAIPGAELETEGFRAIFCQSPLRFKQRKNTPVLQVESKITVSESGVLLRQGMITISGEAFRDEVKIGEEFQSLAQKIVKLAMENSER